jgi:hypothetical protein
MRHRRLVLRSSTLRDLSSSELQGAAGGLPKTFAGECPSVRCSQMGACGSAGCTNGAPSVCNSPEC